jgi:hypothetical protein
MAGIVLALAGLTAGDGGQSGGAARAPVEMTPRDEFWCYIRAPGGPLLEMVLFKENLNIRWPGVGYGNRPAALTLDGEGRFRLTCARGALRGTVSYQGRWMVLNVKPPLSQFVNSDTRTLLHILRTPPLKP